MTGLVLITGEWPISGLVHGGIHFEACMKAKLCREGAESVGLTKKNLGAPGEYLSCVRFIFWKELVGQPSLVGVSHLCGVDRRLGLESGVDLVLELFVILALICLGELAIRHLELIQGSNSCTTCSPL